MLGHLRRVRIADDVDARTPWEMNAPPERLIDYEIAQVRRSVDRHLVGLTHVAQLGRAVE